MKDAETVKEYSAWELVKSNSKPTFPALMFSNVLVVEWFE